MNTHKGTIRGLCLLLVLSCCLLCGLAGAWAEESTAQVIRAAQDVTYGKRIDAHMDGSGQSHVYHLYNDTDTPAYYNLQVVNKTVGVTSGYGRPRTMIVEALDTNGEVLADGEIWWKGGDAREVSVRLMPGETAYGRVYMGTDLKSAVGDFEVMILEVPDEAGETIATAADIIYDKKLEHRISGHGDIDVYRLYNDTDTPSFYNVQVVNVDLPATTSYGLARMVNMEILDAEDEVLSSGYISRQGGEPRELSVRLEPGEESFFQIYMGGDYFARTGKYEIAVYEVADEAGETIATAADIIYDKKLKHRITGHGDVDVYRLYNGTETASFYNVQVVNVDLPATTGYGLARMVNMEILDAEGAVLSENYISRQGGNPREMSVRLEPGEEAFFQIFMGEDYFASTGEYEITVYEVADEAGETIATAADIAYGKKLTHRITGHGDIDVYRLANDTEAPAFYNVAVVNVSLPVTSGYGAPRTLIIDIVDEEGESLTSGTIWWSDSAPRQLSLRLLPGETVYCRVYMGEDLHSATGEYQIIVDEVPDPESNTAQEAVLLVVDARQVFTLGGQGDKDYFLLRNDTQDALFSMLTVKNIDYPTDIELLVLDEEEEQLARFTVSTDKTSEIALQKLLPDEAMYLCVTRENDEKTRVGSYQFVLAQTPDDIGDTPETAMAAPLGEAISGQMNGYGDVDCFTLAVTGDGAGSVIEIVNNDIKAGWGASALIAVLWDENENEVTSTGVVDNEKLLFDAKENKTYTLRLYMGKDAMGRTGGYTIRACGGDTHFLDGMEWTQEKTPSCVADGLRTKKCALCRKDVESEVLPATGHTESGWEVITEATCAEEGQRAKHCTVCYERLAEESIAKRDHVFGEWAVTKEATKNEEGEETRVCEQCGEKETKPIEMLPKNFFDRLFGG